LRTRFLARKLKQQEYAISYGGPVLGIMAFDYEACARRRLVKKLDLHEFNDLAG
jgi:hypothetical protein